MFSDPAFLRSLSTFALTAVIVDASRAVAALKEAADRAAAMMLCIDKSKALPSNRIGTCISEKIVRSDFGQLSSTDSAARQCISMLLLLSFPPHVSITARSARQSRPIEFARAASVMLRPIDEGAAEAAGVNAAQYQGSLSDEQRRACGA